MQIADPASGGIDIPERRCPAYLRLELEYCSMARRFCPGK
jgi:hypothetical protein